DGWLNLIDRIELAPGSFRVGSGAGNDLVLGKGPADLGVLTLDATGQARFVPVGAETGAAPLVFLPVGEAPPRLIIGGLLLEMTEVEAQYALRVRDLDPGSRQGFAGLRYFPVNPDWRIRADWITLDAPQSVAIGLVNGVTSTVTLTHKALFFHAGTRVELLPTHLKSGQPMFVIRDLTSRDATYGASRFLYGEDVGDGQITLDFNKAFNPPCAFTDLAICPLPPRENILPFRIEAGELRP
ncbi:MAG: DUF1684 domain-containing protein, partial [Paracoccaceae bacterium]|nr:DUF1684 domain-containing protein [Paracoccaceae bacterium]